MQNSAESPRPLQRRRAELCDLEALVELDGESWPINFPDEPYSAEASRHTIERGLRREPIYVYEADGELVGWLWLEFKGPWGAAHVRHLQVVSARWGRGYGAAILRDAIALVQDAGGKALTLNVTKSNTRAMRLYSKLGFVLDADNGTRQRMRLRLTTGQR